MPLPLLCLRPCPCPVPRPSPHALPTVLPRPMKPYRNEKMVRSVKENIDKQTRLAIEEAALLEVEECMNPKTGRSSLSETAAKLMLAVHKLNF